MKELLITFLLTAIICAGSGCDDQQPEPRPEDQCPFPLPAVDEVVSQLQGLGLEEFIDASYFHINCRQKYYANRFRNISDEHLQTTYDLQAAVLNLLRGYDRQALLFDEQVSYDVYEWYLADKEQRRPFMYHDYPVNHYIYSIIDDLEYYFTYYRILDKEYAEYYIQALEHLDTTFADLQQGLNKREQMGVLPPRFSIEATLQILDGLSPPNAYDHVFYQHFEQELAAIADMSAQTKEDLIAEAGSKIEQVVIPGFRNLAQYWRALLEAGALTDHGVGALPDGAAYYSYMLRHHTTTDMTADDVHALGLAEVERIRREMRALFDQLGEGYPEDESLVELFTRLAEDSGYVTGMQICDTYEAIIDQAMASLDPAFNRIPTTPLEVICGSEGDYYMPAWGDRPGQFFAKIETNEALYSMPTLAYHEAVPGHHFQISLAQESSLPEFRTHMDLTVYAEGWALYAEQLAWELGWYEGDLFGDLGRLQGEILRAARLVVDTGIHAKGWSFDQALKYMVDNTGYTFEVLDLESEIGRYFVLPGQATSYKIGMKRILELRQQAMDQLGELYDLKEFHDAVLGQGSVPLAVLDRVVQGYIDAKLTGTYVPRALTPSRHIRARRAQNQWLAPRPPIPKSISK